MPRQCARKLHGLTLIEVLVVVCIVGVIATLAAPDLTRALTNQRLRGAATDLVSALLLARSEAIKRGVQVQVAPLAAGDWKSGWRVVTTSSGEQVEKTDALGQWVDVQYAPSTIAYERSGRLAGVGVAQIEFRANANAPGVTSRCVTIDPSGMPRVARASCS
jgi:type IV fimbrial biogenesis protein FimT